MNPVRAALEYTTLANVEHSLVEVDDLLHRKLVDLAALRARYAEMARWPGTLITDLVLRLADGRSESVGETRARYLVWSQGLPPPEVNYPIFDESGREVARVDLAWPAYGLFLEFDGKVKYERLLREGDSASDVVFREKQREDMICRLTGWRCIRIVWADLYKHEVTAFFANVAAASYAVPTTENAEGEKLQYLRALGPLNPESLASYNNRLAMNRNSAYSPPKWAEGLVSGLPSFDVRQCSSGITAALAPFVPESAESKALAERTEKGTQIEAEKLYALLKKYAFAEQESTTTVPAPGCTQQSPLKSINGAGGRTLYQQTFEQTGE